MIISLSKMTSGVLTNDSEQQRLLEERILDSDDIFERIGFLTTNNVKAYDINFKGRLSTLLSDLPKESKVLDIGCGSGECLREIKKNSYSVTGISLVKYPSSIENDVIIGDAIEVMAKMQSQQFNLILSNCLGCIADRLAVITEAYRVLASDGTALLTIPIDSTYVDGQADKKLIKPTEDIHFEIEDWLSEESAFTLHRAYLEMRKNKKIPTISFPLIFELVKREGQHVESFYRHL